MAQFTIVCPYCQREIALDEALTHHIKEEIQKETQREVAELKKKLEEKETKLAQQKADLEAAFETRLADATAKVKEEALKKAQESLALEMKELSDRLAARDREVKELKNQELQLRREKEQLQEARENLELEVMRRISEERERLRNELTQKIVEEHQLKDREREKIIKDLTAEIEELRRKAEQGSQQLRGEVLELALEELLRQHFPQDTIEPVPKGMRGADVIQTVCGPSGQPCGTIIWESKRVKNWQEDWIDKLKEDQRAAKADTAALVSTVLPRDARGIVQLNGVWVADYSLAVGLAMLLRNALIRTAGVKASMIGRDEKLNLLYDYLSGPEFRQQVEGIVDAFVNLKKDLDAERRAMEKHWARREKQIERVLKNTARMYGSLQGVIGRAMPEIPALEFTGDKAP